MKSNKELWIRAAEFYASRHDARRSYEWKIILGFWAAILATLYKDFRVPRISGDWWIFSWLAFVIFWLFGTWIRNHADSRREKYCMNRALGYNSNEPIMTEEPDRLDYRMWLAFFSDWARQFQMVATASIMFIAWRRALPDLATSDTVFVVVIIFWICLVVALTRKANTA